MRLKQSTAVAISYGPALDPTDGVTLVTGLVSAIDHASTGIKLSKNGGALTIRHATVTASTYDGYGNYIVTLDTTDTNTLGTLRVQFAAAASCVPVWMDFEVVNANEWDSSFGTSVRKFADLDQIKTVSQSATDLKDFADAGYDPATHKVAEVLLTDTLTTYTGNTLQTGDAFARIGVAGAGLTNIDLPDQAMNITGNLSGSVGSVTGLTASDVGAIKAKTDNLPASPAAVGSAMTLTSGERNSVADALKARNISSAASTGRTVGQALASLRNKQEIAGGTLTIYDIDDTTPLWDAAVTTAAGNPLASIDPS